PAAVLVDPRNGGRRSRLGWHFCFVRFRRHAAHPSLRSFPTRRSSDLLKSCARPVMQYPRNAPLIPVRPRNRFVRYLRTQVLLYKSDVIRGNIIYGAFDLSLMTIRSLRHRHSTQNDDSCDDLPMSPVSPDTLFPQLTFTER